MEATSFDALPRALIRARIATGLSQRDLPEKLGLKEELIQHYEESLYASVSVTRLKEVIAALGVRAGEKVFLRCARKCLFRRLEQDGILKKLVLEKLVPSDIAAAIEDGAAEAQQDATVQVASYVERIFGWASGSLFTDRELRLIDARYSAECLKTVASAENRRLQAYSVYAYELALHTLKVTRDVAQKSISTVAHAVRHSILAAHGSLTFETALEYAWDLGMPVLPLNDAGEFHGACWRIRGRNIIVLRQESSANARWLFDLLHKMRRAAEEPVKSDLGAINTRPIAPGRHESAEEQIAHDFAIDVLLDGGELEQMRLQEAGGDLAGLKRAVELVSDREGVEAEILPTKWLA